MSTRGVIARLKGALPLRFAGRYHHWDSYPNGLGKTLWDLYHGYFDRDLEAMLGVLLDEHPAGWSQIIGADFYAVPGFKERTINGWDANGSTLSEANAAEADSQPKVDEDVSVYNRPQCYCHGDRAESEMLLTEANATWSGCEWAYVFLPAAESRYQVMLVLSSYTPKGQKMIGFFGQGDRRAFWTVVGIVGLQGTEPDWSKLESGMPLETFFLPNPLGEGNKATASQCNTSQSMAWGSGPSVHPDRGWAGTYIVLTPAKGPHYVGIGQEEDETRAYYCTCSPVEDKPSPDCEHSLLVWQYLKERKQTVAARQRAGLEYTIQRAGSYDCAALVWEGGEPRFLLLEKSHYLLAGFPCRRENSWLAGFALAVLLDYTGDEVLSLARHRQFAYFLTNAAVEPISTQPFWWHINGQQIAEFLAGR